MRSGEKPKGKTAIQSKAGVSSHSSFLPLTLDTCRKLLHPSFIKLEDRRVNTKEKLLIFVQLWKQMHILSEVIKSLNTKNIF